ncbi:MAG: ribonuclease domain-containing protein [Burkholderiaceae bacterium]
MKKRQSLTAAITALLAVIVLNWLGVPLPGTNSGPAAEAPPLQAPASGQAGGAGGSAITEIAFGELPAQAREVVRLIRDGGPFKYEKDGTTFGNRERLLPAAERGYYREYTVETPGESTRGARRIVTGGPARKPVVMYYTSDHYRSFRRIREEH